LYRFVEPAEGDQRLAGDRPRPCGRRLGLVDRGEDALGELGRFAAHGVTCVGILAGSAEQQRHGVDPVPATPVVLEVGAAVGVQGVGEVGGAPGRAARAHEQLFVAAPDAASGFDLLGAGKVGVGEDAAEQLQSEGRLVVVDERLRVLAAHRGVFEARSQRGIGNPAELVVAQVRSQHLEDLPHLREVGWAR
jgi:hypothetical protein